MTPYRPEKCYRCWYCGLDFPAWLPVMRRPDGAMLLHHLSRTHPREARPYLDLMRTEDIATVGIGGV